MAFGDDSPSHWQTLGISHKDFEERFPGRLTDNISGEEIGPMPPKTQDRFS